MRLVQSSAAHKHGDDKTDRNRRRTHRERRNDPTGEKCFSL